MVPYTLIIFELLYMHNNAAFDVAYLLLRQTVLNLPLTPSKSVTIKELKVRSQKSAIAHRIRNNNGSLRKYWFINNQ